MPNHRLKQPAKSFAAIGGTPMQRGSDVADLARGDIALGCCQAEHSHCETQRYTLYLLRCRFLTRGGLMTRARTIAIGFICLVGTGMPCLAQEFDKKLLPMPGVSHEEFGSSVSVHGNIAIIGARLNDQRQVDSGAAYIFARERGVWRQQSVLLPTDGIFSQQFGVGVAIHGHTVVVGAWRDRVNGLYSGSAYVFARSGLNWHQQAKLLPADGSALDEFGRKVAVDGRTIGIAAGFDDDNGPNSGSAYVFVRRGGHWIEDAKLLPIDGQPSDVFGADIALDGDTVIVGAALDDDQGTDSGSVYVFVRFGSTWIQQAKLLPDDGNENARFGSSVALDGNTVLIGAPDDDDNGRQSGSAYVFARTNGVWTQSAKLLPSDGVCGDGFGTSVALSDDVAAIGAPGDDDRQIGAGSFYLFVREGGDWKEQAEVLAPDGDFADEFGTAVAVHGGTIISSSPNNRENGPNAGAAYVFRVDRTYSENDDN